MQTEETFGTTREQISASLRPKVECLKSEQRTSDLEKVIASLVEDKKNLVALEYLVKELKTENTTIKNILEVKQSKWINVNSRNIFTNKNSLITPTHSKRPLMVL